ncbi:hypothetical protein AN8474.2 [Aspergillus nidulans FGSC A4]|uniref:Major facilitator superfamily (MFS) profile domain-containing protein n=1 Tax=Emericella nidulans (strain FGSC A4 / ATCC 38163 / CBS 112.46 / NRRL 194 / M139) TaxID=227321 RepID=Q5ATA6_EMENI|nr:hypothetical protein [Aspergillus nidulans FGSC A4]EAA67096.1 hypothetical protein AN8474.2 [Aspergillus nidulans FGSC A4]CBF80624.1 TPA: hypothetical protein ANIA_08474 [Aspergillus nidulans FGSC A4]|eukprot:XP_681743.1 hypothetical protein AN8474.2 [Aspergillus nidulans FGSC A4]
MTEVDKADITYVEDIEDGRVSATDGSGKKKVMGTVKLTDGKVVYIPTPTADPQGITLLSHALRPGVLTKHIVDPLNMAIWQKWIVLVVISIFSTLGLALVSGFGGLLGFYIPGYEAVGKGYDDITHLMTYPTLFMGIGNLIGMPLAIGIGRRIVLLASTIVLVIGAILCAAQENYEWHLWSRCAVGLAAGQSEALVPMITQEIFFLHERSKALMGQQAIQVSLTAVWVLFAGEIANAITPQWWYGLGAALAGAQLVLAFFFLPETKYERSIASFQEGNSDEDGDAKVGVEVVCTERPPLDFERYAARTWKSDMRLWVGKPDWGLVWDVLRQTFELLFFPNVFWALCLNGLTIGTNIAIGTTYANILHASPYNWPNKSASYVNCGQIVVALLALPLLGHGSDWIAKHMARKNNGLHEPETRIVSLIIPIVIGTFTAVLYGQAGQYPEKYHWFVYPARAGPLLVIICAFRGIISFGTSYGTATFVETHGYDGAFGTFAGLTAALGLCGVPIYLWGKRIRAFTGRFARGFVVS